MQAPNFASPPFLSTVVNTSSIPVNIQSLNTKKENQYKANNKDLIEDRDTINEDALALFAKDGSNSKYTSVLNQEESRKRTDTYDKTTIEWFNSIKN